MSSVIGSLRKLVLAPSLADVTFARRGFPSGTEAGRRLELIPQSVVCGFEWGIESPSQGDVERRLEFVDPVLRGFACEGVTMAFAVRDAMAAGRPERTRQLLRGPAAPHVFLAYIGVGFALARLPRPLWKRIVPQLDAVPEYADLHWLAVDGYAFDLAYFNPQQWVSAQRRPAPYRWAGDPDYFLRAADQGIGRALWFIHAAQPAEVTAAVRRFARDRQADLWSGVGLAATFAGGCPPEGLARLVAAAGPDSAGLGQGSVFAIKARHRSGHVPDFGAEALEALSGLDVAGAVRLADEAGERAVAAPGVPRYESWRHQVRVALPALARH